MKGCVQWNRVYGLKDFGFQGGIEQGTDRSMGQS